MGCPFLALLARRRFQLGKVRGCTEILPTAPSVSGAHLGKVGAGRAPSRDSLGNALPWVNFGEGAEPPGCAWSSLGLLGRFLAAASAGDGGFCGGL